MTILRECVECRQSLMTLGPNQEDRLGICQIFYTAYSSLNSANFTDSWKSYPSPKVFYTNATCVTCDKFRVCSNISLYGTVQIFRYNFWHNCRILDPFCDINLSNVLFKPSYSNLFSTGHHQHQQYHQNLIISCTIHILLQHPSAELRLNNKSLNEDHTFL